MHSGQCDKVTPSCQRCQDRGIDCQYPNPTKSLLLNSQGVATERPKNKNSVVKFQSVSVPLWPGPFVLTVSGQEGQFGNGDDLRLLHHFQTFISHELGSPAFDGVRENVVLSLALEVS